MSTLNRTVSVTGLEDRRLLSAGTVISEIMFNPQGITDTPNEYIELRGTPNTVLSTGTYLIGVEGDDVGGLGDVQNIFDLSGKAIGSNGYLVLLQSGSTYSFNGGANTVTSTVTGWGDGTGNIGHNADGTSSVIENDSVTFFLIVGGTAPTLTTDIDSDNNGIANGDDYSSWTILDSVGIHDGGGNDRTYGALSFRMGTVATLSGTVVDVSYVSPPGYVARVGNSTTHFANDWIAADTSNFGGSPSTNYTFAADSTPGTLNGLAVTDDIGALNTFGVNIAPVIASIGGSVTYATGGPRVVLSSTAEVNDPDSADFNTGTLTVSVTTNNDANDRLEIRNQGTGAGQIGRSGSNVTFGGTTIGTWSGGTGTTPLVITFNASATEAEAQAVVRNITYFTVNAGSNLSRGVQFVLTDGDGGTSAAAIKNVSIFPGGINDAPTINPQTFSVNENSSNSTAVGTVVASEIDPGQSLTYAITAGNTGGAFAINSATGQLTVANAAAVDFETTPTFSLTVEVTDDGTPTALSASATVTVNLSNLNDPPTAVTFQNTTTSLAENTSTTTAIKLADIVVTDDALGTNALSLSGTDAAFFEIVGNELRLKAGTVLDFETKNSYAVTVNVDDAIVFSTPDASAIFTLSISDVNEPPTAVALQNTTTTLLENTSTATATKLADIAVTDDALGTNVLSLSGTDAASFEIVGTELRLKAGVVLDFETQNSYAVTVNVDDTTVGGTPDASANFTLTITNVAELTAVLSGGNLTITDTDPNGGNNTLTASVSGLNLVITSVEESFAAAPAGGALTNGNKTLTIALADVTGQLVFNTAGGNDTLTVDFSGGNPVPAGGLTFNGGTGGSDSLTVTGGSTTGVTHTFTNANDGSVTLAGALAGTISYTGLEPVTDNLSAVDRVFTFNGGAETIALTDATGAAMTIDSTLGESVTFANPTGSLTINAGSGDDTVTITSVDAAYNVDLTINGGLGNDTVNLNADITFASGESLDVDLQNDDATPGTDTINVGTNANLILSGTGAATLKASRNIALASGSSIATVDGGMTLNANSGSLTGTFVGIDVDGATLTTSGTGAISLTGRGGSTGDSNVGVRFRNGTRVESTQTAVGAGTIAVVGTGGNGGAANFGVYVTGTTSTVTSVVGAISITGTGRGTGVGGNYGVGLDNGGSITSTGTTASAATIGVAGTAGGGGQTNHGVWMDGAVADPSITSVAGAITVTGTGGTATGPGARGVVLLGGASISSTGTTAGGGTAASVNITGNGGTNGTNNRIGVQVSGSGSAITSVDGELQITGTGGIGGSGTGSRGVSVDAAGLVRTTGRGSLTVTGTEGTGGTLRDGIIVTGAGSTISTALGTESLTLIANNINLDTANAVITAGTNTAKLRQRTNGTLINVGGADVLTTTLGLTDAELDRITAGTLVIGDGNSGAITVSADISRAAATAMQLTSGGAISFTTGSLNTNGGNVLLTPGSAASVDVSKTGNDVTVGAASTLSFANGSDLSLPINGTTVDTDYQQLDVVGQVNLTGVDLVLSGSYTPTAADTFVIIDNDGTDAFIGTFTGLVEGALVSVNGVQKQLTYIGGNGNDVVLLAINQPPSAVVLTPSSASLAEDASTATATNLTTISVTDDALGTNVLSLSGADAASFEIVGNQLRLKAGVTLDFETQPTYSVTVNVDDATLGGSPDAFATFTLNLTDVNEPPEIEVTVSATDVPDGGAVGFGAVAQSSVVTRTFAVRNTGTGVMTLQPIAITGSDFTVTSGNFTVGQQLAVNATASFTVTMNTATAGSKSGELSFVNDDPNENPFNISLSGSVNAAVSGAILLDDGDAGFALTGSWLNVTGYGFGSDAKAATGSDGSKKATWTFNNLTAGLYRIEATWLPGSDRANNAPYVIRDGIGGTVVGNVVVNQRNAPAGATSQGGRPFSVLGAVTITGDTLVVELANTATNGAIIADAMRLVSVTLPPNTPEIDVLDGAASLTDGAAYDFGQVTQGVTVTKTFTVKNVGTANLLLQPITVTGSAFSRTSTNFTVGQVLAPNATVDITVAMNTTNLGTFSGGLSFGNNDGDEGPFDLTFTGKVNPPGATVFTLDDGDAGFTLAGSWNNVAGYGYGADAKAATGTNGANKATWTFSGLTAGEYKLAATWLPGTDRANNAPYVIRDGVGGAVLSNVAVNQRNAPSGAASDGGRPFANLGSVTITGTALVIELSNTGTNGAIIADAIRIERITAAPNTPRLDVQDGATTLLDNGTLNLGSATQGGAALTKTITVRNTGTANLILQPITVSGAGFSLVSANFTAGQVLAPNATVDITVQLATTTVGTLNGTLSFGHNDGGPFDLALTGTINVAQPPGVHLIDDGDAGFALTGSSWLNVTGYGFGSDAKAATGSDGTKKATWIFTGLDAGQYRIAATWLPGTDRADNAAYAFKDGAVTIGTASVNQRNAPAGGPTVGGRPFSNIGLVTISGNTLTIELANLAGTNGAIIADAIRIEKIA